MCETFSSYWIRCHAYATSWPSALRKLLVPATIISEVNFHLVLRVTQTGYVTSNASESST